MAINRVDFGSKTLIDLSGDTLESAEQLLKGIIAHARDGSVITGLLEAGGGGGDSEYVIEVGTITFAESFIPNADNPLVIQHSLGKKPILFFATNGQSGYYPKYQICYLFCATILWSVLRSTYSGYTYSNNAGGSNMGGSYANKKIVFSSTDITVGGSNSFAFLSDGTHASTLKWIAVAEK